jgi:hypothetical protein
LLILCLVALSLLYLVIHTGLQGDDAFQAKDFEKAIEHYTEAITLTASEPNKVIFGNRSVKVDAIAFVSQQRGLLLFCWGTIRDRHRSLAFSKVNRWLEALSDAEVSL